MVILQVKVQLQLHASTKTWLFIFFKYAKLQKKILNFSDQDILLVKKAFISISIYI